MTASVNSQRNTLSSITCFCEDLNTPRLHSRLCAFGKSSISPVRSQTKFAHPRARCACSRARAINGCGVAAHGYRAYLPGSSEIGIRQLYFPGMIRPIEHEACEVRYCPVAYIYVARLNDPPNHMYILHRAGGCWRSKRLVQLRKRQIEVTSKTMSSKSKRTRSVGLAALRDHTLWFDRSYAGFQLDQ